MNFEFKLVCPNCGYNNAKSGSRVGETMSIDCRNCGFRISFKTDTLRAQILALEPTINASLLSDFTLKIK